MPLQTSLSPAARRDEASTFLLLLINATSQLTGYNTWLERAGTQAAPSAGLCSFVNSNRGGWRWQDAGGGAEGDKSFSDV